MNRDEIGKNECQKDPIFLLEVRRFWLSPDAPYRSNDEKLIDYDGADVDEDVVVEDGHGIHYYEVQSVFSTREEAREWGISNRHNLGKENRHWRVYCVSAIGDLAKLLRAPA